MKVHFKKAAKKGFSLVELLVVIAVIGIMAAIAIPMISNINAKSKDAKDRRNAQSIASMAASAVAAGTDLSTYADVDALVAAIVDPGLEAPDESSFKDTKFQVPSLSADDQEGAATYLTLDANNNLIYSPNW